MDACEGEVPPDPLCRNASDCDDGDACTTDSCDPVDGCKHAANPSCGGPVNCNGTGATTLEMQDDEMRVLEVINLERKKRGRGPLRACRSLAAAAQKHSADMRDRRYFSHMGKNNSAPWDRGCSAGYSVGCGPFWYPTRWYGETIIAGYPDPDTIVPGWMGSPPHRDLLLDSAYTVVGIGHACGGTVWASYWTADFGNPWEQSCD